ncbi:cell division protein SepF [Actinopolymorpha pittospori]|uniref:Cell division protein SepF n=1 Tax=Actinopolymorpha pittospori TaxID=648752 RepID=A0A927N1C4_9ACTN|nr:cell division protein SepF [Actinopolymorpha pittospori]MBE1610821.1 cell division inhibitor SepF [Actinopolymorpha pittospori]
MAGAMRKVAVYLGLVEDQGRYDDEYDGAYEGDFEAEDGYPTTRPAPQQQQPAQEERAANVAAFPDRRRVQVAPEVSEMSRITTLHPRTYNDARLIGEHFRDGTPVIMNLTGMDDSDAKRLVDFAAGLIFGLRGSIERVTAKVFLLSPANVVVRAEDKERMAEAGFFNQS